MWCYIHVYVILSGSRGFVNCTRVIVIFIDLGYFLTPLLLVNLFHYSSSHSFLSLRPLPGPGCLPRSSSGTRCALGDPTVLYPLELGSRTPRHSQGTRGLGLLLGPLRPSVEDTRRSSEQCLRWRKDFKMLSRSIESSGVRICFMF